MCVGLASVGFRCGMAMQRRRCVTRTVAPALGIVQGDMRPDVPVRGGGSRTRRGVALTYAQDASIICRRHSPRRGSCIWTPVIDDIMVLVVFRQVWRWRRRTQAMDVCDASASACAGRPSTLPSHPSQWPSERRTTPTLVPPEIDGQPPFSSILIFFSPWPCRDAGPSLPWIGCGLCAPPPMSGHLGDADGHVPAVLSRS